MSGSAATLSPTCFIVAMVRGPANRRPRDSIATFSLTHHSQ